MFSRRLSTCLNKLRFLNRNRCKSARVPIRPCVDAHISSKRMQMHLIIDATSVRTPPGPKPKLKLFEFSIITHTFYECDSVRYNIIIWFSRQSNVIEFRIHGILIHIYVIIFFCQLAFSFSCIFRTQNKAKEIESTEKNSHSFGYAATLALG